MLIQKIHRNGFWRLVKIYTVRVFATLRGFVFGLSNCQPIFPKTIRVGKNVESSSRYLKVGSNVTIGSYCSFGGLGQIILADRVVLNRNVHIDANQLIEIGEGSLIGPDCYFVDSNHVMPTDGPLISGHIVSKPIKIGKNVWIGRGVTILAGVEIGDYAVIGAGALVNKKIPSKTKAVGVPVKILENTR
ncbi:MAG: acyltransferase [Pseudomonadota bacterium]